ncbi:hypothetical protein QVG61_00060 [Thiohalobacter sp. IOR34]|uniref:hypothetical protein n=1 Tax=Thiohalobacter sp. IOR34 TaxID=3057176 RepID=UPI0025B0383A|nr:hypothetical protein [Thiohalobacter sp. IOR34]WJW75519.1 hypothetical protein QVG61_00060 [Thiohalobacter sp. IOR34]
MKSLVLEPTSTAQWHALVSEAEAACECRLGEELQSYLVFLLMRFAARPDLAGRVMALEFLRGVTASGRFQVEQLRDVGDQCLLYSGFYPQQAERRLVRVSYFVGLGRSAYGMLAERLRHAAAQVYQNLSEGFVSLRDVLAAMRELDGEPVLDPLHQAELWQDTGSRQARRALAGLSDALPVPGDERHRH